MSSIYILQKQQLSADTKNSDSRNQILSRPLPSILVMIKDIHRDATDAQVSLDNHENTPNLPLSESSNYYRYQHLANATSDYLEQY